jgi:hypothetical protein
MEITRRNKENLRGCPYKVYISRYITSFFKLYCDCKINRYQFEGQRGIKKQENGEVEQRGAS